MWQEDNARPHKGKVLMKNRAGRPRRISEWPPNSPSLNPRAYSLWSVLKDVILRKMRKTLGELKGGTVWGSRGDGQRHRQPDDRRVPKRLQQCVDAQGGAAGKKDARGTAAEHM